MDCGPGPLHCHRGAVASMTLLAALGGAAGGVLCLIEPVGGAGLIVGALSLGLSATAVHRLQSENDGLRATVHGLRARLQGATRAGATLHDPVDLGPVVSQTSDVTDAPPEDVLHEPEIRVVPGVALQPRPVDIVPADKPPRG